MRLRWVLLFLLVCAPALAQFTTVTGTVIDPNGIPYSNGTIVPTLVSSASPTLNGFSYAPPSGPVGLNINGSFTMNLASQASLLPGGTTWAFNVCSSTGTVQPAGGTGPQCFVVTGIVVAGASQSISAQLTAAAKALTRITTSPAASASGLIIPSTGITPPTPLATLNCPTGDPVWGYFQNAAGNYQDQFSLDNTTAHAAATKGKLNLGCWGLDFNDSGARPTAGNNNAFNFFHVWGNGGVQTAGTNGAALSVFTRNTGTQQDFSGTGQLVTGYFENVMTGASTILPSGPEPAMSALRGTLQDARTGGTLSGGSGGIWAISTNAELSTNGSYTSGAAGGVFGAIRASVDAGSTPVASGDHGSDIVNSLMADGKYGAATATNLGWAGVQIDAPVGGIRFPFVNYGLWIKNFGTNANDYNIRSDGVNSAGTAAGFNAFVGPTTLGVLAHAAAGYQLDVTGAEKLAGNLDQIQSDTTTAAFNNSTFELTLNPSATKTGASDVVKITQQSSVTQAISGRIRGLEVRMTPQSTGTITRTEGVSVSNFATGTNNFGTVIGGYFDTETLTTGGTTTTNESLLVQSGSAAAGATTTTDIGINVANPSLSGTLSNHYGIFFSGGHTGGANNTNGWAIFENGNDKNQFGLYFTQQRCAANGTAANPSVVSCGSAPAGEFSCATASSAGTCQVNTTAVTANSQIQLQSTASANTLGVTCNTAPTVTPAVVLASINAGVSFTINSPTFTVNPVCFYYTLMN